LNRLHTACTASCWTASGATVAKGVVRSPQVSRQTDTAFFSPPAASPSSRSSGSSIELKQDVIVRFLEVDACPGRHPPLSLPSSSPFPTLAVLCPVLLESLLELCTAAWAPLLGQLPPHRCSGVTRWSGSRSFLGLRGDSTEDWVFFCKMPVACPILTLGVPDPLAGQSCRRGHVKGSMQVA
jgi:hypothetical protein